MKRSTDRILTTHAGSLPRPAELRQLMWDQLEGKPVDDADLEVQVRAAVKDVVERQRQAGIDVISDGEMGKVGFSNYVFQHYTGFEEDAQFMAADLAEFPELTMKLVSDGLHHVVLRTLKGPIEPRDPDWVQAEIADFQAALGDTDPTTRSSPPSRPDRSRSTSRTATTRPTRPISKPPRARCARSTRRSSTRGSTSSSTHPTWRWRVIASCRARI